MTAEDVEDLFAERLYVNIHSEEYTSEAIRGVFEKDVETDPGDDPTVVAPGMCGASAGAALLMTFLGLSTLRIGRRAGQIV
jgi:hypothetical protein